MRVGVSVAVPPPWADELAGWRRRVGDPEGARVPPHVTLLPPTWIDAGLLPDVHRQLAAAAAEVPPFELHLAGTGTFRPVSDVVFVVVAAGIGPLEQLEHRIRRGPLVRELRFPYHPHVTVAHDVDPAGLDAAYAGLARFEARFPVQVFTMFSQGSDGGWQPRRDFALAAAGQRPG